MKTGSLSASSFTLHTPQLSESYPLQDAAFIRLTVMLWTSLAILLGAVQAVRPPLVVQDPTSLTYGDKKVPVTLGVMSRCPDALLCESVFDHVLKKVGDKVDLSLTFIGK